VFIKERLIVTRERSSGKGSTYGPGPYFISKLAAELPVTALFPCLFGGIMYPLAGTPSLPPSFSALSFPLTVLSVRLLRKMNQPDNQVNEMNLSRLTKAINYILNPTGLQMTPQKFLKFLGILIVESYAAAGFGMFVGTLVPSVDAGLAVAPAVMVLFIVLGGTLLPPLLPLLPSLPSSLLPPDVFRCLMTRSSFPPSLPPSLPPSGYYVNEKSVPLALRWIQDVRMKGGRERGRERGREGGSGSLYYFSFCP